jgi:hypothetical protein
VTRRFSVLSTSTVRGLVAVFAVGLAVLACAASAFASLTPGDVVVQRDGNGGVESLTSNATALYLDEFEPRGGFATSIALPTAENEGGAGNKPITDSGTATSDGGLTLSGNGECLLTVGINAKPGTEKVLATQDTANPRVVALVNGAGEVNTTTALTNFANENNPRSATSSECKKLWVGGAGNKTSGGVLATEVGKKEGTELNEDKNVRQVEVVGNQLYTSADPTQTGAFTIATVGSGLPTTKGQTITNLPFATSPEEPYAYSLLTLGLGSTPDTLYVADNKKGAETSAIVKYGLSEGKWVEHGSVEIPEVTGVTANDVNGVVTIYATSSGTSHEKGTLYRISDVSGVNGTLSGAPVEIAKAPTNEAWRGVAFAPGTVIGSGGTPPPLPTIVAAEPSLPAALGDPTNKTMPITVEDSAVPAKELTVLVNSSKESVAPVGGISVTGTGKERVLHVTPGEVGQSKLTLTVEAPDGAFSSTQINYGVSANEGYESDRYYSGNGTTSASFSVGGGYMITAGDETNEIRLYKERESGPPLKTWNFDSSLPFGATSINIHGAARAGNTAYFVGGFDNTGGGEAQPARNTMFAVHITGSGTSTELSYLGSYTDLRENLTTWDTNNGSPLGLQASAAAGKAGESPEGFKIEGVDFLPGSTTEAYLTFRAPLEPPGEIKAGDRNKALVIPVTNFSSLFGGNPGTTPATFGTPLEWSIPNPFAAEPEEPGGLTIRSFRANGEGEYLIIASSANSSDKRFEVWGWDGEPEDEPVPLNEEVPQVAEGVWGAITSTPEPIRNGSEAELMQDNGKTHWYGGSKDAENGLITGLQKSLGQLVKLEIPAPGTPEPPKLVSGGNPNKGEFTIKWKPAPTLRARFTLQHQNAEKGGWTTVASNLSKREYTFKPEAQDTWNYRVKESNETGESGFSTESEAIKVDRTAPLTPTPHPEPATPAYSGKGGWYKDTVTVSFTSNGDPTLPDGSPGSGIKAGSLTSPETFNTSGSHEACGTVEDNVGNKSSKGCVTVQVDATPPTLEITCPATAVQGESVDATVTASDGQSGLAQDPSGTVPINTATTGPQTTTRTAIDNVGHETTKSCTTEVVYPTPGAPKVSSGGNPNNGHFTLTWTGANPGSNMGLSYTLQQRAITSPTWTTVASGIETLSYEFPKSAKEAEGTWLYRVQAVDSVNLKQTPFSGESEAVVVGLPPELGKCVEAPSETVNGKTVFTGAFTRNTCSALSKKHNGQFNWQGGVTKGHFFSSNTTNAVTFLTSNSVTKAKVKVECSSENVTGEFVSPRRAEGMSLKLGGCSSLFGKCTSPGAGESKIITKTLDGVFGDYKTAAKSSGDKAGLEVSPANKAEPFAEFTCGAKAVIVRGGVVLAVRADKVTPTLELSAKANGKGEQKIKGFVEEPTEVLEVSIEGGAYEPLGLTVVAMPLETEEPLELNTVA